jgi:hypothetical protein
MASPQRQAALNYELWRLAQEHEEAQTAAAAFYQADYAETGAEESRRRYQALTGEALPDPPLLPDSSELIPDEAVDLAGLAARLAPLLTELATSFE